MEFVLLLIYEFMSIFLVYGPKSKQPSYFRYNSLVCISEFRMTMVKQLSDFGVKNKELKDPIF